MRKTTKAVVPAVLLFFLTSCTQRQQDQAQDRGEQAKHDARTAAEKLKTEAQRLGREAEGDARQLKRDVNQAVKPGEIQRDSTAPSEKLRNGAQELAAAGNEAAVKLDHAALITRVKAKIASDAGLSTAGNITVDANGDVVTLRGTVSSDAQRTAAENAAEKAGGVSKVINEIQVQR